MFYRFDPIASRERRSAQGRRALGGGVSSVPPRPGSPSPEDRSDGGDHGPRTGDEALHALPERFALLLALTLALYARHLGDVLVSDDWVFLRWAHEGLGSLLHHATVASQPQSIRPLPAVLWLVELLPGGTVVHRSLSLILHAANATLVATLAGRAAHRAAATILGALFVAFPLFTEPVIWLSAAPDLWATLFALATLVVALGRPDGRATVLAGLLFAAGLLSKETILLLPVAALLLPRPLRPRLGRIGLLAAVSVGYLGVRIALFRGLGGYTVAGRSLAFDVEPLHLVRNVFLQTPVRVLVPIKGAHDVALPLAATSLAFLVAIVWSSGAHRRPARAVAIGAAALAALAPVLPVFSVDWELAGGRLVYFPAAVVLAGAGTLVVRSGRGSLVTATALLALWSGATLSNATAWSEASHEVRTTLDTLREHGDRFPSGSTVLVAGHDSRRGAFVWRNAFGIAATLADLRDDVLWRHGTAALLRNPRLLGRRAFEVEVEPDGTLVDWTAYVAALESADPRVLAAWDPGAGGPLPAGDPAVGPWLDLGGGGPRAIAFLVDIRPGPGPSAEARLHWRTDDDEPFHLEASRAVRLAPRRTSVAPVRGEPGVGGRIQLVVVPRPGTDLERLRRIEVVEAPEARRHESSLGVVEVVAASGPGSARTGRAQSRDSR